MEQLKKNKRFIINYMNALSGVKKTPELLDRYMTDAGLKEHILFFDSVFPKCTAFVDELIAEGNKVVLRARLKGRHEGAMNGIPPTYRDVEYSFVVCYEIKNDRIVHHWIIADQVTLMEQLGIIDQAEATR
jgi:predicted ester cyclase